MAERPRNACDFKGVGHLRLNFRLKRVTFRTNVYGPLDGGMVILQLCHWKSSHKETLHFAADFIRLKLILFKKTKNIFLFHPWGT